MNEQATLVAVDEAGRVTPEEFRLGASPCSIGRSENCTIIVRREDVSRLHARIEREGERYVLSDANSANGTFVNGRPLLKPYPLKHRDMIGLGDSVPLLRFLDPNPTIERRARLRYDPDRLSFFLGANELRLTPNESRLLLFLYEHRGELCLFERCAIAIWGEDYEPGRDARLDGVLRDVRNKLRAIDPSMAEAIKTHRGKGYELIG